MLRKGPLRRPLPRRVRGDGASVHRPKTAVAGLRAGRDRRDHVLDLLPASRRQHRHDRPALRGQGAATRGRPQVKIQMGLDKPIGMQFVYFMKHLFLGDQYGWPGFGKSFTLREPLTPDPVGADVHHAAARARGRGDVAPDRDPHRRVVCASTTIPLRSSGDGLRAGRHLDPGVRAGSDGALGLLVPNALTPGDRLPVPAGVRLLAVVQPLPLALVRAGAAVRGVLRASVAGEPDRDDGRGLHAHRAGQGPVASGA